MNRREFLAAAIVAACSDVVIAKPTPASQPDSDSIVDAGLLTDFKVDGVIDRFREQGFFVIRRNKQLFVLSAICTHKGCKVRAQDDGSFVCKCHKSAFSADGKVLRGPAIRNLPRLAVKADERGHVLVNLGRKIESA